MKKLCITGCGRSGTVFITKFCRSVGLDITHETSKGTFGSVGWNFAYRTTDFECRFHQVRDPLKVIRSTTWMTERNRRFISDTVGYEIPSSPTILRAASFWYHWNVFAESNTDWTYKIEDFYFGSDVSKEWFLRIGVPYPSEFPKISTTTNRKPKGHSKQRLEKEVTWDDLASFGGIKNRVYDLAIKYGYTYE